MHFFFLSFRWTCPHLCWHVCCWSASWRSTRAQYVSRCTLFCIGFFFSFPRDTQVSGGRTCSTRLTIKCSADHPLLNCCLDQCSSISSVLFITPFFPPLFYSSSLANGIEKKMREKGNLFRYH